MRSIATTNITFGTLGIGIPIKLYKARDDLSVHFHQGCKTCGGRVSQKKICNGCGGKELNGEDITKLYPRGNENIAIDKDKLPKFEAGDIRIVSVATAEQLNGIYGNFGLALKEFYMVGYDTKKVRTKATIEALFSALKQKAYIGIGKAVFRSKENLIAIMPIGKSLFVAILQYPSEIRENPYTLTEGVCPKELADFIGSLEKMPEEEFWQDRPREAIESIIDGKEAVVVAEPNDFLMAIKKEVRGG